MSTNAARDHGPARGRPRSAPEDGGLRGQALQTLQAAMSKALASASEETLAAIIGAANDPAQALAIASRDLAPVAPNRLAVERAAKARTASFRTDLAEKAGGMFSRAEVSDLLGVTPAAVTRQRQRGEILGVPYGTETRFPAAQFRDAAVVAGLKPVLAAFGDMNPWGQLQLLVTPIEGFGDEPASILELLASGVDDAAREQLVRLVRGWTA